MYKSQVAVPCALDVAGLLPILPSVPLIRRAMLPRCMIHSRTVSSTNSALSGRCPSAHTATGVAAPLAPLLATVRKLIGVWVAMLRTVP